MPSVKLRFLENFTLYLRNSWSLNLRAIESCICGLRPIERKMRSILRTVCKTVHDIEKSEGISLSNTSSVGVQGESVRQ